MPPPHHMRMLEKYRVPPPKSLKEVPGYLKKLLGGFFTRFLYIFRLVWEASPLIMVAMTLMCIFNGAFPVLGAYITAELLNCLVDGYNYAKEAIGLGLSSSDTVAYVLERIPIIFWMIMQFSYLLLNKVLSTAYSTISTISGEKVSQYIKIKIISKAKEVDLASFDQPDFYEKMENANREAGMRPLQIMSATLNMVSNLISAISFVVILATLSLWAPVLIIVLSLPTAIVRFAYSRRSFRYIRFSSKERRKMQYYSNMMTDKDVAKEVRIFHLSDTFIGRYRENFKKYFSGLKKIIVRENTWHIALAILTTAGNCLLFIYVALKVCSGELVVGDYSLYTGALTSIAGCVSAIITSTSTVYEGTLFIENMIAFDKVETRVVPTLDPPRPVTKHVGHVIEFCDVSFTYPGAAAPSLKHLNFRLEAGETVVLVGLNGAGKTTLIKLLTRLYDPTEGVILLDGHDLREYNVSDLYDLFGIIFQDFGKYAVTVKENIGFGDISKQPFDDDEIRDAAVQSTASLFIEQFKDGYQTELTRYFEESGTELSIGQWQKLSVSRAFYGDSDILILDEPTASLDAIAEQEIFNQFDRLRQNKTTIFVSHRLSSATTADKIIVIDHGEIIEIGNHNQLINLGGKYCELFTTQAKHYREEVDSDDVLDTPDRRPPNPEKSNISVHTEESEG